MTDAVFLADKNDRGVIAAIRSLRGHGVRTHPMVDVNGSRRSRVRWRGFSAPGVGVLTYTSRDAATLVDSLLDARKRIGEYVLFPSGERLLRWAIARRSTLRDEGVILPTVDLQTYEAISDKSSFAALARRHGLDVPRELGGIPSTFDVRFVVKAKRLSANDPTALESPRLVESAAALGDLERLHLDPDRHFVQEYIEGPSYYYCGLYDSGRLRFGFVQKNLTQQPNGKSVIRAIPSTLPPELTETIDRMMASLEFHGIMMFEVKRGGGRYYAIECNPRVWGPMQLAVDNGADFPYGLWCLATGRDVPAAHRSTPAVGYRWTAGYAQGIAIRHRTNSPFQRWPAAPDPSSEFLDVWCRRGTLGFFCWELFRNVGGAVKSYLQCLRS